MPDSEDDAPAAESEAPAAKSAGNAASLVTLDGRRTNPRLIAASALMFEDPASRCVAERIGKLAPSEANILIVGETGTGKELAARYIHSLSARRDGPFIAVNSAGLSETLADSELFGHERGAFTGAHAAKPGWFETAQGGTLFLDEIGELPLPLQVKLLRVLQEREVVRLGSRRPIAIDVRLVTATNVDLERAMAAGSFREDLYYRLKVAEVRLPPLRERAGDILPLARYFLEGYATRLGAGAVSLSPQAASRLESYPWPGNIRELENVVHHALLIRGGAVLSVEDLHLPPLGLGVECPTLPASLEAAVGELIDRATPDLYSRVNETLLRLAFAHCGGNQVRTARLLGVSRNVVRGQLARIGLIERSRP